YDFSAVRLFVARLREGYDLVMGNRFQGGIKPGAMPYLHRYLGNPVLSAVGRLFFASPCGDFHCGLRGFSKDGICRMELQTTGMEFASEMVVKATLFRMRITIGLIGSIYALSDWRSQLFGPLDPVRTLRVVIPSILSLILGLQTILSSFFLSVLGMGRK